MADENNRAAVETSEPIVFGRRLAGSRVFKALFREGMTLVEETATYLDGDGRADSRGLSRTGSLTYATESMRLTTRLMQLASWLLLQRAVNDHEISDEQAVAEKAKVKLSGVTDASLCPGWDDLPERLRDLIERSVRLQVRIRRLDGAMEEGALTVQPENPVALQLGRVAEAFARR